MREIDFTPVKLKETNTSAFSNLELDLIKTLAYFDIFNYPLIPDELVDFSKLEMENIKENVIKKLKLLTDKEVIYEFNGYYLLQNDKRLVDRRIAGNNKANSVMNKAFRRAHFIGQFPFVRSVYLSGSISKGFLDEEGDVDFFVITKEGRLWISRTFLILFKKIFLGNSKKYFCVNYFIDENHLKIEEENLFTATEITTLTPAFDRNLYDRFCDENSWSKFFYPNFPKQKIQHHGTKNSSVLEKLLESVLGNTFLMKVEVFFMKLTIKRWKKKFTTFDKVEFDLALKSTTNVSKHHPQNFQNKVINSFNKKLINLEKLYNIKFH